MWPWRKQELVQPVRKPCRLFSWMPRLNCLRFGYEKGGGQVAGEPLAWNADTVFVEALLDPPHPAPLIRDDLVLEIPGEGPVPASAVELSPGEGLVGAWFRLPPARRTRLVSLHWKGRLLGHAALPCLLPESFLRNLRVEAPTVFARLGGQDVACRCLVEGQYASLTLGAMLRNPTSLLPIIDWPLTVELTDLAAGRAEVLPLCLTGAQVLDRQAVLCTTVAIRPRAAGFWSVRWKVADQVLAQTEFRVISEESFRESLYMPEGRRSESPGRAAASPGLRGSVSRAGPCFQIASRVPGIAAVCPVEIHLRARGQTGPARRLTCDVLVTESPSAQLAPPVALDEFRGVEAFDLFSAGRFLGRVSWEPGPRTAITSEGGFLESPYGPWTVLSEVELEERLTRLGLPSA